MQIAEKLGVSLSFVHLTLWLQKKYGVPYHLNCVQLGQKCVLSASSIEFIDKLLVADNTLYLDEIQEQLFLVHGIKVSISTVKCTLDWMCFSHK
jgi:hypothetical protein